ncbi:MAG: RNA-binding protein [Bacteroidota bacterium]
MNIYVANIPWKASEDQLKQLFSEYGEVHTAKIIMDKVTQRSRGFGFIEMPDESSARNAINGLNGADFLGKNLVVNEARPREDRPNNFRSNGGGGYKKGGYSRNDD